MNESFRALYPFTSRWLEVPGGRLHYVDEGPRDAPAMLLLHGNPTWSFMYRDLIRNFSAGHRVIALDHLGCGLSDKPERWEYTLSAHISNVERLSDALGLTGLTLVVHDWGGAIGMGFATRRPEKVSRFVVFNTAAFTSSHMPASIALARLPGFGPLAIRGLNAFALGALYTCVEHKERLTREVRAGYLAPYDSWKNRVALLRFVQDIPMKPGHPSWQTLVAVEQGLAKLEDRPMLIIWGAKDFVFSDLFLEGWRRRFPNARVHYVQDAGHYVLEDAGERIVPWIRTFFWETKG